MAGKRIMVVEDEIVISMDIDNRLKNLGYEIVCTAHSGEDAIATAREINPDLILMDIKLEGEMDGIEAAAQIRKTQDVPVVFLTAFAEEDRFDRKQKTYLYGYIPKPFRDRELYTTIENALEKHSPFIFDNQLQY